jgi:hypothetical protein
MHRWIVFRISDLEEPAFHNVLYLIFWNNRTMITHNKFHVLNFRCNVLKKIFFHQIYAEVLPLSGVDLSKLWFSAEGSSSS